jgi:hypothetical protein
VPVSRPRAVSPRHAACMLLSRWNDAASSTCAVSTGEVLRTARAGTPAACTAALIRCAVNTADSSPAPAPPVTPPAAGGGPARSVTSMPGAYAPAAAPITMVPLPGTAPSVTLPSALRHRHPSTATAPRLAAASRSGALRRSARTCPRRRAAPPSPAPSPAGTRTGTAGRSPADGSVARGSIGGPSLRRWEQTSDVSVIRDTCGDLVRRVAKITGKPPVSGHSASPPPSSRPEVPPRAPHPR